MQKKRPENEFSLYDEIIIEINNEILKGRPVLIIMDSLKQNLKIYM